MGYMLATLMPEGIIGRTQQVSSWQQVGIRPPDPEILQR
jgi:hypothetical protein